MGQEVFGTEGKGPANIYHQTLIRFCDYQETQRDKLYTVYIEENSPLTQDLPGQIKAYRLEYLTGNLLKSLLIDKEELILWRLLPLKADGERFTVQFNSFRVTYRKGSFSYAPGPRFEALYGYDVSRKGLVYQSSELKRK